MGYRHDDYECKKCKHVFEEMTNTNSDSAVLCPSCKGKTVRLMSAPLINWRAMGIDPAFPTAYAKWAKNKTAHHKTDKGMMHGGKAPNLSQY
jgi:putative FmdB family regulatory protein